MPKGNTNAIRIGNLHLATARLPSHIHQSKSTVQGLVSFFTGYPPGKGSYLNIVLPTEDFLSFSTFLPLVNQGIHFFCFCFFPSFLLESYKGFNNAETCSWSGGYDSTVRYSLIISIETPLTEIDIYTPVQNMVKTLITT